jgi:hypothetical protein
MEIAFIWDARPMANRGANDTFLCERRPSRKKGGATMSWPFTLLILLALAALAVELTVSNEDRLEHPKSQPRIESQNEFNHPQRQRYEPGA